MRLHGRIQVDVPVGRLWAFLMTPHEFSTCIPGLESVSQVSETAFDGAVRAKIGPLGGTFAFTSTIVDSREPEAMTVRVEGTESATSGRVTMDIRLTLTPGAAGGTLMAYAADVGISGRLAVVGEMVVRATAGALIEEFARRARRRLESADGHAAKEGS